MLLAVLIAIATTTCAIKSAPKLPPLCGRDTWPSDAPCRLYALLRR
jgi:hypothetical protein